MGRKRPLPDALPPRPDHRTVGAPQEELRQIHDPDAQSARLCELNVLRQVRHVSVLHDCCWSASPHSKSTLLSCKYTHCCTTCPADFPRLHQSHRGGGMG